LDKFKQKTKILWANVLKLVTDVRTQQRLANSLPENLYEHYFFGRCTNEKSEKNYGLKISKRFSLNRLIAPIKMACVIKKIKPHILVISAVELLPYIFIYKLLSAKTKIIYDLQENYHHNIKFQNNYPAFIKNILAKFVRMIEYFSAKKLSGIIYAEKCYIHEVPIISKTKHIYWPNKMPLSKKNSELYIKNEKKNSFLLSGTINESNGIFEAIQFAEKQYKINEQFELIIFGQIVSKKLFKMVKEITKNKIYITNKSSLSPIPFEQILLAMHQAQALLLPYQINPSNKDRIPSKLYEAISLKVPVIISKNASWGKLISTLDAGLSIDFQDFSEDLLSIVSEKNFFQKEIDQHHIYLTEQEELASFFQACIQ